MRNIMKRALAYVVVLAMLMAAVPVNQYAAETENWIDSAASSYAGGTGTSEDPYQIATPEQLAKLAADTNSAVVGKVPESKDYFRLTADIDLSGKLWTPIGCHMGNNSMSSFCGHFDGNGKTISGMTVDMRDVDESKVTPSGLFGSIAAAHTDYTIQNLTVSGAKVYSFKKAAERINEDLNAYVNAAGVLAADVAALGGSNGVPIIRNCVVTDSAVTGVRQAAGLLGNASYAQITSCKVSGTQVTGDGCTAGFAAYAFACDIKDSAVSNAAVSGTWSVGGFAGEISDGSVENCTASGEVTATDWHSGGFVGFANVFNDTLNIKKCTSDVVVKCLSGDGYEPRTGAFVGQLVSVTELSDCNALGEVVDSHLDKNAVGRFAGRAAESLNIVNCTYNNKVNAELAVIGTGAACTVDQIGPYYAEYAAVDAAIKAAEALNKDIYKDFTAVTEAVNAVVRDKRAFEQAVVDGYARQSMMR